MKTTRFLYRGLALLSLSLAFSACQQEDGLSPSPTGQAKASFVVSAVSANTRVSYPGYDDEENYVRSWMETGDELGAFVIGKDVSDDGSTYHYLDGYTRNARFVVTDGKFEHEDGDTHLTYDHALQPVIPTDVFPASQRYVFYYPYKEGAEVTSFSHTVLADQSTQGAYESSDLLRARVNATDDESAVDNSVIGTGENGSQLLAVNLAHCMASIVVKVAKDVLVDEEKSAPGEATLLNVYRSVSGIDLTRTMTKEEQEGNSEYATIPGEKTQKGNVTMWLAQEPTYQQEGEEYFIYRAVVPAQKVENETGFLRLNFANNSSGGEDRVYSLGISSGGLDLEPAKYYLFTVTRHDGLRFRGLIEDLEEGGDHYYEY